MSRSSLMSTVRGGSTGSVRGGSVRGGGPNTPTKKKNTYSWNGGSSGGFKPANLNSQIGSDIQKAYKKGPVKNFQQGDKVNKGLLYTGLGDTTKSGLDGMVSTAEQNSQGLQDAYDFNQGILNGNSKSLTEQQLLGVAQGDYLSGGNPYIQDIISQTNNDIYADVMASFGGSGGVGSGLQTDQLARSIGQNTSGILANNYENERERQVQALGLIEGMRQQQLGNRMTAANNSAGLFNNTLLPDQIKTQVGQQYDADRNAMQQAKFERYQRNSDPAYNHLAKYASLLGAQSANPQPEEEPGLFDWLGMGLNAVGTVAPLLLSDERAKEDIKKVGKTNDGQQIYSYKYKGDPAGKTHMGLMAQEVLKKTPDAVAQFANGLLAVNYEKALETA